MLELFPEGFEELEHADAVELVAYTDDAGEERLWAAFGEVRADDVPADWEERWREFHRPVTVGKLWIGPPWETPPAGVEAIVVDPGRAFGTGGHATTRLCLQLLANLERGSLLDVGCGSGVLAIAAARLGFAPVVALDHDAAAIDAARRNAEANGVELDLRLTDARADQPPQADVAVANISLETVERVVPLLDATAVVTSGYLEQEQPSAPGFRHEARATEGGWAADLYRREE
ncbi:MAG TPA: 50S ribosomal protein L11 methyltransferase [Gaiellaceae bacterium]|jgi:ribosomal protein L11 methyltransferase|nr:50S ribosomal protein L11 methyltransferase [Gaiellaceae bacterium]